MFITLEKRLLCTAVIIALIVLAATSSCSTQGNGQVSVISTGEKSTNTPTEVKQTISAPTQVKRATSTPLLPPQPPPRCDSSALILPESVVASAEEVDTEEYLRRVGERVQEQRSWLSLHLDLEQSVFEYDKPIPFRLTVTNETDQPVVFRRPQSISLDWSGTPSDLIIELVSFTGQKVEPKREDAFAEVWETLPMGREAFSMLPQRSSCAIDLKLIRQKVWTPLAEPIPPGDYEMHVTFDGGPLGPDAKSTIISYTSYDVGGWIGRTEPSNVVTLTIRPPEE